MASTRALDCGGGSGSGGGGGSGGGKGTAAVGGGAAAVAVAAARVAACVAVLAAAAVAATCGWWRHGGSSARRLPLLVIPRGAGAGRSLCACARARGMFFLFYFFFKIFKKSYFLKPNNPAEKAHPAVLPRSGDLGFRRLAAGSGAGVWPLASGLPCCRLLSSSPPAGASARHRPGSATGRALLRPAALGVTARRAPPQRPAPAFCRFCARPGVARAASRRPFT